jgi:hypothetical protein
MTFYGLDSSGLGEEAVVGFSKKGNKILGLIKGR